MKRFYLLVVVSHVCFSMTLRSQSISLRINDSTQELLELVPPNAGFPSGYMVDDMSIYSGDLAYQHYVNEKTEVFFRLGTKYSINDFSSENGVFKSLRKNQDLIFNLGLIKEVLSSEKFKINSGIYANYVIGLPT